MPTPSEIDAAATRLAPYIRRTPSWPLTLTEQRDSPPVTLKLEFLQHSGSFKARGAFNRMLTARVPKAGVIAASGGNHGAAVAYAARRLGHPATIFVPGPTPQAKLDRIASYGASIVQGGDTYAEAFEASQARQAESGALVVHAYDDPAVLAGQGTVGRELQRDAPELTHVLVAVGGGGLIGGITASYTGGRARIVAVEPEACPTLHAALAAGRPFPVQVGGVAADSLGARQSGALMFPIVQQAGVISVLVPDSAIKAAQAWLWNTIRIVAEPGGATALAALLCGAWAPPPGSRVGIILCGANTDPGSLPNL